MNARATQVRVEFWAVVALGLKGWRIARRYPFFLTSILTEPMRWMLPIVLATIALAGPNNAGLENFVRLTGTDAYLAYSVVGTTAFVWTAYIMADLALNLRLERSLGTLSTTWATPTSRVVLICGDSIGRTFSPTVVAVGAFGLVWVLFRFPLEPNVGPALAVLVCGGLATVGIALPWAAIVLRYREGQFFVTLFIMATGIVAGIAYPVDLLPAWAQGLAGFQPATWMIRGLRDVLIFSDLRDAALSCGVLFVMSLVYGAAGLVLLRVMDKAARAKGELELF